MLNIFLSGFEKFEVIILVTVFIALVIQITIGYFQERVGSKDVFKRIQEYYREKDVFAEKKQKLELDKNKLKRKIQEFDERTHSLKEEKQQLEEEYEDYMLELQAEECQNQKQSEFLKKMISENGYHHSDEAMKHAKDVITASATKRKFLKFLKEEFPKSDNPYVFQAIYSELQSLFKDTKYYDYVLEAFEDRANKCNPVLVAFEHYTCYITKNGA